MSAADKVETEFLPISVLRFQLATQSESFYYLLYWMMIIIVNITLPTTGAPSKAATTELGTFFYRFYIYSF